MLRAWCPVMLQRHGTGSRLASTWYQMQYYSVGLASIQVLVCTCEDYYRTITPYAHTCVHPHTQIN